MEAGVQAPRVDWPVYPRHVEHNTVAEGGHKRWAETAVRTRVPIALTEGRPEAPGLTRSAHGPEAVDHVRRESD